MAASWPWEHASNGIAWRAADSLALRSFLPFDRLRAVSEVERRIGLEELPPDHLTISRKTASIEGDFCNIL